MRGFISVRGARQHNLKNLHFDLPLNRLTVITGLSGSGKSSLAFDTLYAEGQRRYAETFSPYTRQFLDRMQKPDVDRIEGIPPAIAIGQANSVRTSRSTVGTLTEIADYLKMLFPRRATLTCPLCGRDIRKWAPQEIIADLLAHSASTDALILFEVPFPANTSWDEVPPFLARQGYLRFLWQGSPRRLDAGQPPDYETLAATAFHLSIVQDRLTLAAENKARLAEALETALRLGNGIVEVRPTSDGEPLRYANRWICPYDRTEFPEPNPRLFAFNSPIAACPTCNGFGRIIGLNLDLVIPDRSLTLAQGAIRPWQSGMSAECQKDLLRACRRADVPVDVPFDQLSPEHQRFVVEGEFPADLSPEQAWEKGLWYGVRGYFKWLESKTYKMHVRVLLSRYRSYQTCPDCQGTRFNRTVTAWKIAGRTLPEINALPVSEAVAFFRDLPDGDASQLALLRQIRARLDYLNQVGLGYLTLDRPTRSLSGGELQRVNLTACLGTALVGTLFVLDEPSIGLHPRDTRMLTGILRRLVDAGNTVVVVEHDEAMIRHADHLLELGPAQGEQGGQLVFQGSPDQIIRANTLTGDYLAGRRLIPLPRTRRPVSPDKVNFLEFNQASIHNLREFSCQIPLRRFVAVTGVSGSGKSTLVHEVIYKHTLAALRRPVDELCPLHALRGAEHVDQVILVDQTPLAQSPRSAVILYLGAYDALRELFAATDEAKRAGYSASAFSFNSGTGRCERCHGTGFEKISMQFLSDLYLPCPACGGKRFQKELLAIPYRGLGIDGWLNLPAREAMARLEPDDPSDHPRSPILRRQILESLRLLDEVGLGYLRLGQPLSHLSGGEAQRLKLTAHLASATQASADRASTSLLILDEPTTGLHLDDVRILINVLQRLVDAGHSLLVIEHNLDVIKSADWILDLGPEAGAGGGRLVAEGPPESVSQNPESITGQFLRPLLTQSPKESHAIQKSVSPAVRKIANGPRHIEIRGARHHNLKNIDLRIPLHQFVVLTGLSGSGKSTLAFDILFSEGQRRYLDCLNTYARQFVEQLEKPAVDSITGIPPTVAIEQRTTRGGSKSTVATVTELYQFLRLLYAKVGQLHDPETGEPAIRQTTAQVLNQARAHLLQHGSQAVLAPVIKARKGYHTEVARWAAKKGYPLLRVDGAWVEPSAFTALDRYREHSVEVVVGHAQPKDQDDLLRAALELGKGTFYLVDGQDRQVIFSTELHCPMAGRSYDELDPRQFSYNSPHGWCPTCQGFGTLADLRLDADTDLEREQQEEWLRESLAGDQLRLCPDCQGTRLNPLARAVTVGGVRVDVLNHFTVAEARRFFKKQRWSPRQKAILRDILPEIDARLAFLEHVGLDYLNLDRAAPTLSGGESQRIRLAAQMGSNLQGVLYVLDEPTIGLHPRDNEKLLASIHDLRARGNSLIVVEHDEDTIRAADHIIDLGPGAGVHGGQVVAQGSPTALARKKHSLTAQVLGSPLPHPASGSRRPVDSTVPHLRFTGLTQNNLRDLSVSIPVGRLTVVTGVSGSGKSTLMRKCVLPLLRQAIAQKTVRRSARSSGPTLKADALPRQIIEVDQSPIGKNSRSTVATYLGIMDALRDLYASLPESRRRGFSPGHFSHNAGSGRCPACQGLGMLKVEMPFMPPVFVPCETCGGKRYRDEVLAVTYRDRSIYDALELSVAEAAVHFEAITSIAVPLRLLEETGLGYLKLGQSSPTLSGGESQRLKLVSELAASLDPRAALRWATRSSNSFNFYLLEEPSVGLHLADVERLAAMLHRLVEVGHTMVVIEHNLDLIAEADFILDLGPESGPKGGQVVACGSPEVVARARKSHTARYLAPFLNRRRPSVTQNQSRSRAQKKTGGTPPRGTAGLAILPSA
ncbi:MAG: excinuclease ABC subunit UvrA [Candidatus Methylacidiphilales bacterium]